MTDHSTPLSYVPRLRAALQDSGYAYQDVVGLLGADAHQALARNETTPGLRATTGRTPLETLVRLWVLQSTVPVEDAERALPGLVDVLCGVGVLERSVAEVAARVDLRPYAAELTTGTRSLWVASDLTPGLDGGPNRVQADHVLGISPAATMLAQLTPRRPVDRALDLGTGCGVQALHLRDHVAEVVATDVNPRALWLTRLNAALNEVDVDVREGDLFAPVRTERFDLVVTNPPFVISPATGQRLVYRDSGLPGDRVVEDIVRTVPRHLAEGGLCQVLANWLITADRPWGERLDDWLDPACAAWVVQREVLDLPSYVELWLKDEGAHPATGGDPAEYRRRYDTWLSWLAEQGAEAVGFGWVTIRAGGGAHRLEEWPWEVAQPLGAEVADHFDRAAWLASTDDAGLEAACLVVRADVQQETVGTPGAEDPSAVLLRQRDRMRRARRVSTAEAAFVGACDGDLEVGRLRSAVAQLTGEPVDLTVVRDLVTGGFLAPDGHPAARAG